MKICKASARDGSLSELLKGGVFVSGHRLMPLETTTVACPYRIFRNVNLSGVPEMGVFIYGL